MNRVFRAAVYVLAAIGVLWVFLTALWYFGDLCTVNAVSYAASPDGKLAARFDQIVCTDERGTMAHVSIGKPGGVAWDVVLHAPATTNEIGLTWLNISELQVTVPNNIAADTRDRIDDDYRVSFRRVPANDLRQ